ncbi:MAG: MBL fold metallo-hydrolase [Firmicutes bacterium]|nr:MBL fold metallo-hydrolase [Bacillota bacterium]
MEITFIGATRTVTGSCHLVDTPAGKILVDCGVYQGGEELEEKNHEPFPFNPRDVRYVLLTHAHNDHVGRLPLLYQRGFEGLTFCTPPTAALARVVLLDSAHLQAMEVEWQNRKRQRAGLPPLKPLYSSDDVLACLPKISPVFYHQPLELGPGVQVVFHDAGHILGSAGIELRISPAAPAAFKGGTQGPSGPSGDQETTAAEKEAPAPYIIYFTGDLGQRDQPIVRDPEILPRADVLVLESTYGGRLHEGKGERLAELARIVNETVRQGGNVVIPAFALERTQEVVYELNLLSEQGSIPRVPIYVDSPMAVSATDIFRHFPEDFDQETKDLLAKGDDPFDFPGLHYTRTAEESKALNQVRGAVIISASGMADAGRIKHHLKHNLWRPESAVVIVGYQAEGTLGRRLLDGARKVSIFGEEISVHARIYSLQSYSAHADQGDLLAFVEAMPQRPRQVFLVHGEEKGMQALAGEIQRRLGLPVALPRFGEKFRVGPAAARTAPASETAGPALEEETVKGRLEDLEREYSRLVRVLKLLTAKPGGAGVPWDRLRQLSQEIGRLSGLLEQMAARGEDNLKETAS